MTTNIQWTWVPLPDGTFAKGETWNPVVGCGHVSAGCDNCYARTLHDRRYIAQKRGNFPTAPLQYRRPFKNVQLLPGRLSTPLRWRKPRGVFVNSVSDLFHEDVPFDFVDRVFKIMADTPRHTYQILTKRPERLRNYMEYRRKWAFALRLPNVWLGVSVENQAAADERIPLLLETPAAVRFLSCEPLLGPLDLSPWLAFQGEYDKAEWHLAHYGASQPLHWVIIGGESGQHARPMEIAWIESLLSQCWEAQVPAFVKQLGAVWAHANRAHGVRDSHGGTMADWPEHLRIREFPQTGGDA